MLKQTETEGHQDRQFGHPSSSYSLHEMQSILEHMKRSLDKLAHMARCQWKASRETENSRKLERLTRAIERIARHQ